MLDKQFVASDTRPVYMDIHGRIGLEPVVYRAKLGSRIKTTPVHPADAGFLSGATSTQPDNCFLDWTESEDDYDSHHHHGHGHDHDHDYDPGKINLAPTAGVFVGVGTDALRAYVGASVRVNPMYWADSYRDGMYSIRKQVSDVRDDDFASFVYSQVRPGAMSIIPAAGVRVAIDKWVFIGEVGFPYQRWYAESGHDRFGKWQEMQSDHWTGFGIRYSATVGRKFNENMGFFGTVLYEDYERVKFLGQRADISGAGAMFGAMWHW